MQVGELQSSGVSPNIREKEFLKETEMELSPGQEEKQETAFCFYDSSFLLN